MNNADLYILEESIKLIESKVYRDYMELENLQNSSKTVMFANMTLEFMRQKFYDFFRKKRPNYSLIIKDYTKYIVENSDSTIYVNCISGIKNFSHAVPYFATILGIKKNDKFNVGLVNSYAEKQMFYSVSGEGSFVNRMKIRTSSRNNLNDSLIAIKYDNNRKIFNKIIEKLPLFRINNCSILDTCSTACGKYDCNIILDGIKEELEIGELFVRESGGLSYYLNEEKTNCIYSNSLILNEIKKMFNK